LLKARGVDFTLEQGFGEVPDAILIRKSDLEEIKDFLSEFRVTLRSGEKVSIAW
jgi:hypothetical protein